MGKKKSTKAATKQQDAPAVEPVATVPTPPVVEAAPLGEKTVAEPAQPPAINEPRSRYDDLALDDQDDSVYLPPSINLEGMTKDQLATTSMRYLGHRLPEATKDAQVAQVRRELRAGLPGYGR